jgi:hypothetical protein
MDTCRQAQRVKVAPRTKGSAVTQRRDTQARYFCVGIGRADLPALDARFPTAFCHGFGKQHDGTNDFILMLQGIGKGKGELGKRIGG